MQPNRWNDTLQLQCRYKTKLTIIINSQILSQVIKNIKTKLVTWLKTSSKCRMVECQRNVILNRTLYHIRSVIVVDSKNSNFTEKFSLIMQQKDLNVK